jgi:hypothetical protein
MVLFIIYALQCQFGSPSSWHLQNVGGSSWSALIGEGLDFGFRYSQCIRCQDYWHNCKVYRPGTNSVSTNWVLEFVNGSHAWCVAECLASSVQDWSLQCLSNAIWPFRIYSISLITPFKTQPQIENEDITWSPQYKMPTTRTNKRRALSLQKVELDDWWLILNSSHCTRNMYHIIHTQV